MVDAYPVVLMCLGKGKRKPLDFRDRQHYGDFLTALFLRLFDGRRPPEENAARVHGLSPKAFWGYMREAHYVSLTSPEHFALMRRALGENHLDAQREDPVLVRAFFDGGLFRQKIGDYVTFSMPPKGRIRNVCINGHLGAKIGVRRRATVARFRAQRTRRLQQPPKRLVRPPRMP